MMSCKRLWFLAAALTAALTTLGAPGRASAQFSVTFSETGFASQTIVDNGVGDNDPLTGRISVANFVYDGYRIDTTSGFSNAPGTTEARLEVSALNVTNLADPAQVPITITYADTFTSPTTGNSNVLTRLTDLEDGATITFQSRLNATLGGVLTRNTFGASQNTFTATATSPTFSLAAISTIGSIPIGGTASFQGLTTATIPQQQTVVVPAPPGLVVMLSALPVLGLVGYRRRSRYLKLA